MKKSAVALGLIAVLGGSWAGATWYSGKNIKQQFQAQIDSTNKKLDQFFNNPSIRSNGSVKIDNVKFQRGIFSSDISYDVVFITKSNGTDTVPFNGTLFHGPLPLNQLSHFNFKPVIFSAQTELTKTEKSQKWFGENGKNPLYSNFSVGYDNQILGNLDSDVAVNIEGGDFIWRFSTDYNFKQDGSGQFAISFPHLKFSPPVFKKPDNQNNRDKFVFELTNAKTDLNWKPVSTELNNIIIGKYDAKVENIRVDGKKDNKDYLLEIKGANTAANGNIKNDFVDYDLTYKLGEIHIKSGSDDYKLFDETIFNIQFNHLAAKPLNMLFNEIIKSLPKADNEQHDVSPEMIEAIKALYASNLQFKIAPISLSNQGGKIAADLDAVVNENFLPDTKAGKIIEAFKQFALNVHIDNAAIVDLGTQFGRLSSNSNKEEAEKEAKQSLEGLLLLAKVSPLFIVDDNSVKLNIKLENEKINLNGNMLSLEEFITLINGAPTNTNVE